MRTKLDTPARLMRVSVMPPPGLSREEANSWLRRATRTPLASRASAESCAADQRATNELTLTVAGFDSAGAGADRAFGAVTALRSIPFLMRGAAGNAGAESTRARAGGWGDIVAPSTLLED